MLLSIRSRALVALAALAGTLACAPLAWANKAAPADIPPLKRGEVPLEVVLQKDDLPMRLEIPRNLLPKREKGSGIFGSVDDFRTIMAGLALSLAMVLIGVWIARKYGPARARPIPKSATATAVALLCVCGAAAAWANFPPPSLTKKLQEERKPKLDLVIVERGDKIVLRGSPDDFDKISLAVEKAVDAASALAPTPESPKK